jgi:glutaconate CoA-transferase subunit B
VSGWTPAEMMAVEMSRHLADGEVAIMGAVSALPMAACRLAQLRHAPRLSFVAGGSGAVNPRLHPLPESSCDERLLEAQGVLPLSEVVMLEGRGDLFDVFFAGGLQIDAYGNCNLQRIGEAAHPKLRGPGGVGLPFLPLAGRVVIYTMSHDTRTFVEKVDFISGAARSVTGKGPVLIVTPLCTFDFDRGTRRARLRTTHPGVTAADVLARTGFELAPSRAVAETRPPSPEELDTLRHIDSDGILRRVA